MVSVKRFAILVGLGLLVAVSSPYGEPSAAFSNSQYSVGVDDGYFDRTTGVYSFHGYAPLSLAGTNCTTRYAESANPVVFSQWIIGGAGGVNQLELGVEEQCGGFTFLFWGYRFNNAWNELGFREITADSNGHYFELYRLAGLEWHYKFDGGELSPAVNWAFAGWRAEAGLETNSTSLVIPNHWFSLLQLTADEGPWQPWGTSPGGIVNTPHMCGTWNIAYTRWSAAENVAC